MVVIGKNRSVAPRERAKRASKGRIVVVVGVVQFTVRDAERDFSRPSGSSFVGCPILVTASRDRPARYLAEGGNATRDDAGARVTTETSEEVSRIALSGVRGIVPAGAGATRRVSNLQITGWVRGVGVGGKRR